jgi:outer membrane protein OmpA-like peptidoglycan-associated protein
MTQNGHVAVYRIHFDGGKIKAESEQMLKAIAEVLARDPRLKLQLVVHTDNAGNAAASLQLSRRQASLLLAELRRKYKVSASRIHAVGMGSLAPLASNATEEGRAKNRRVELVPE